MRICSIVDSAVPTDYIIKLKEIKRRNKFLGFARELKNTVQHESDIYTKL